MPGYVDTGLNLVHVDDVATGHLAALARGRIGERYILGGDDVDLGTMLADIARLVGRRPPTIRMPRRALYPLAYAAEAVARITGREPFITVDGLHLARYRMYFTSAKAIRELGYRRAALSRRARRRHRLVPRRGDAAMTAANVAQAVAVVVLAIWVYLAVARGGFWRGRENDRAMHDMLATRPPTRWPRVVAIVPARDEAALVGTTVASLLGQRYDGDLSVTVVDDHSDDGTADVAREAAVAAGAASRLTVIAAPPLPAGWTGKLWALASGIASCEAAPNPPTYLLLTDADIRYGPDAIAALVSFAVDRRSVLTSLMVALRCVSLAERALIPAFVFFFQMLYPFAWVNRPHARSAAAAGGCVLLDREALAAAGGIASIRGALIDDCALARRMKPHGPIHLALGERVESLRAYDRYAEIRRMVVRSAYAQLGFSAGRLALVVVAMLAVFVSPVVLAVASSGPTRIAAVASWLLMSALFVPMLRRYRVASVWALALPAIASVYLAFTVESAWQHWRGRGGMWKGRVNGSVAEPS